MAEGCTLILNGIDTQDNSKLNLGSLKLDESQNEFRTYFAELEKFYKNYGINDNGELQKIQGLLK